MRTDRTEKGQAIAPIQEKPVVPERDSLHPERTFAERLAEAENALGLADRDAGLRSGLKPGESYRGLGVPMSGSWWVTLAEGRRRKRRFGERQGL